MMQSNAENLELWIEKIAHLIEQDVEPDHHVYDGLLQDPHLILFLIPLLAALDESAAELNRPYYSACLFALDICVAQLQAGSENGNKSAQKILNQLMEAIALEMKSQKHGFGFWLPILNAFYVVHVELSKELKEAYLELANDIEEPTLEDELSHLSSIREIIAELSDLSVFDIAENFFAQSYAMPPEFFADLLVDLYSIQEGHDIALLTLLHPKAEVREMVVAVLDQLLPSITLSPISLSRLRAIKHWYPPSYHERFDHWIKQQRMKGVIFHPENTSSDIQILTNAVDANGGQGIFILLHKRRVNRLGGFFYKHSVGIKEVWITQELNAIQFNHYCEETFGHGLMIRNVHINYLLMFTNHFLAKSLEQGNMPELHLLEIQEELGIHFVPELLDIDYWLEQLSVRIEPFTPETLHNSLKRSKLWPNHQRFTEWWFIENAHIDKMVNQCSHFVKGVKVCRFEEALKTVLEEEFELHRDYWLFHFLWMALWLEAKARKNEKAWKDSFYIAYAIHTGVALKDIPIMNQICRLSVINSIETMQDRKTHLS